MQSRVGKMEEAGKRSTKDGCTMYEGCTKERKGGSKGGNRPEGRGFSGGGLSETS